ncbi:MAG: hypothetical protein VB071_11855 [Lawsonibacter sp.]|nr:hypothetical protein [Lawsonibacter sp.]
MEKKLVELCGLCAVKMQESYQVKRVSGGVNNKITCSNCGRRHYGAKYTLEKKSTGNANA